MPFLLAFLGGIAGFCLGEARGLESQILSSVFALICLGYATLRKGVIPYALGFGIFLIIALIFRLTSPSFGRGEIVGVVTKTGENYFVIRTLFDGYYVTSSGHGYQVGDVLRVNGVVKQLRITTYESQFSFLAYLQNIGAEAEIASARISELCVFPLRIGVFKRDFLAHFDTSTRALLDAILFGRKDYSSSTVQLAKSLGLLFVLSSSGLLYSFTLRLIEAGLRVRLDERKSAYLTLVFGAILLPLNIEKIGLWRVFLMRLLGTFNTKGRLDYYARIGLSGLILLAVHPYNALSTGLWIGFGLSLGRYLFAYFLESKDKKRLRAFLEGYAFVQLFLLPLTFSSGDIHPLSLLYGLFLLPLIGGFALLGGISLFTVPFIALLEGYGSTLEKILAFLGNLDVALPLPLLPNWVTFALYVFLVLGLFLHELGFKRFRNGIVIVLGSLYAVSLLPAGYLGLEGLYFVNVGQGDCTLIYNKGKAVMIDTGGVVGMDIAKETLIPYLRKKRIYHLDALIITHGDYDHMGGKESLLAHFDVHSVIDKQEGFPYDFGRIHIQNHNVYGGIEANDRSLVLDFEIVGKRVMVCGDAPKEVEAKILDDVEDLDVDILRVGHHGSKTSTCEKWLDALTPETAIISCGRRNSFGHPNQEVLDRLYARGVEVRRTDLEGSIELTRYVW